jgi:uncharacterized protein
MAQVADTSFLSTLRPAFEAGDGSLEHKSDESANVAAVERTLRALTDLDFSAVGELMREDVVFEIVGSESLPMAGRTQGREQVLERLRANLALVEEQRPQIEAVVAQGDSVVVFARETGRFRPTGREYVLNWVQHYTFADGRIASVRELFDTAALIAIAAPPDGA